MPKWLPPLAPRLHENVLHPRAVLLLPDSAHFDWSHRLALFAAERLTELGHVHHHTIGANPLRRMRIGLHAHAGQLRAHV